MKVNESTSEPQRVKKSVVGGVYRYVKNYAQNCRSSFNRMLSI